MSSTKCNLPENKDIEKMILDYMAKIPGKYGRFYGKHEFFDKGTLAHYISEKVPEIFEINFEPTNIDPLEKMTKNELMDKYSSILSEKAYYGEKLNKKSDIIDKITRMIKAKDRKRQHDLLLNRLNNLIGDVLPCMIEKIGWVYLREMENTEPFFMPVRINRGCNIESANILYIINKA